MITDIDSLGLIPAPLSVRLGEGSSLTGASSIKPVVTLTEEQLGFSEAEESADPALRADAYVLEIKKDGIFIKAHSDAGAFYAEQTLRQLTMTFGDSLPVCRIEDVPVFQWRGFMMDCCRNFFPVDFILKMIDVAALHKLNRFHWHLTDDQGWRFPVKGYERVTQIGAFRSDHRYTWYPEKIKGGFYTAEDIAKVRQCAKEHHVEIVPEIETAGHTLALLASYPELGCVGAGYQVEDRFGIFDDVVCAGNDKVLEFFDKAIESLCELFPESRYIHIGGDECPRTRWWDCEKCRKRIEDNGLYDKNGEPDANQLQGWLTDRYIEMITKRGKLPVGYEEVLKERKEPLSKSMVVHYWNRKDLFEEAVEKGHTILMSPQNEGCYLDARHYDGGFEPGALRTKTVYDSYSFAPLGTGENRLTEEQISHVLGGQGMLWTEIVYFPRNAEYMLFPRLSALSEVFWLREDKKDFDSFSRRLAVHKQRLDALDVVYYKGKLR
ncbi:MAG: beta-N-acetylhexosaminidase [Treponema sp.]|nr:beta-N-acetylhexosaminidase [Candidatus Treponema caballi]